MKLSSKNRYSALILFILLLLVSIILHINNYRQNRTEIKNAYINKFNTEFQICMSTYSEMADFIFQFYIDTDAVKKTFAMGVKTKNKYLQNRYRKELLKTLTPLYKKITLYNFRQLHFHSKNNISFLRFHRPEKYGDDLTGFRDSVKHVNLKKKKMTGFEEGRIYNGYRFVFPMQYRNEHIGSVEISVSMKTLIDKFENLFGQNTRFIIKKNVVEKKVFKNELQNYIEWTIDSHYLMDKSIPVKNITDSHISPEDTLKIKNDINRYSPSASPFCTRITIDGHGIILTFIPVKNITGKHVAYIYNYSSDKRLREISVSFYILLGLMLLLFICMIMFLLYFNYSQNKIQEMITHDYLTKTLTRRTLYEKLNLEYKIYKRYGNIFSVIMVDIDHFKKINDSYSHASGDIILSAVASIMKKAIRDTDSVGRYGGEEFIILLPQTDKNGAATVAEHLRKEISEFNFHRIGTITVSCGVGQMKPEFKTVDELINEADQNLYRAKESGRNRVIS
ncbi:MAG TPA: diguanylate cyclase [Spirochaetota bacterium]|nr:diguanylate cyclase [Spirochaetota bacterium]